MGNQLVGIAPSQIFPVEHYFSGTFGTEIVFDSNMGSTRFFKVAKAKSEEGLIVVKVFVKHDPTLPLEDHKDRVEQIKKTLANSVNCLPFQRVEITDKAAYIMREFVKHSLYDRVSTRPFLTILEKKWISFQILCALNQCHKQKICHGDIKLENILITSWNWILLSDFASFKPTYLPEDNPADYTYFFDTSRRRTCYIAPERFVKTMTSDDAEGNVSESMLPTDSLVRLGSYYSGNTLLPAMDIFSAGCALLELWTEGTAPFELSQLLTYRRGERELVEKHLSGIENEHLRNLLASMINLNSINRRSAEDYLDQERGRLFPEYFYSFLQSYLQMFSSAPIMSPDDKIMRLHSDISHCIKVLTNRPLTNENVPKPEENQADSDTESTKSASQEQDGLILIITVVTSCIRGLQYSNSKICCLEILQNLSEYTTSETILDRILPYILHLAQFSSAKVQVQAIETLTTCLGLVKEIPRSDANVFPEYILPSIAKLSSEQAAVIVRVAFAKNISKLAKIAIYFLEETQRNTPSEMPFRRYQAELNALHEIIQQTVLSLLTDSKPIVKQSLMESGITDLCAFFGKEKANDVVLSHIMTFLNDEDKNLRGAFYDNISGVAGYVGWQASDILVPLLHQGFTDREEFVIAKAIRAVNILIELGHIRKPAVTEMINESACYLCHPNLWIRHEIAAMISTTARIIIDIDVQCKIMPAIEKFLRRPLIQVEMPELLLDSLLPAVPRIIYDSVVQYSEIQKFVTSLEDRKNVRENTPEGMLPQYDEVGTSLKNLYRRLISEGLNEEIEMILLEMKAFILKVKHKHSEPKEQSQNGRVRLDREDILCHDYPLADKSSKMDMRKKGRQDGDPNSNLEWQHIYNDGHSAGASPSGDLIISPVQAGSPSVGQIQPTAAASLGEFTIPERNLWTGELLHKKVVYGISREKFIRLERPSECRFDVDKLRNKIKGRYNATQSYHHERGSSPYPPGWRMNGTIIAHLYEHRGSVIKMTSLKPHGAVFASGSIDGTVRLWDCNKLYGHHGINKSRQVYSASTPIYSLAACDGGQSLAVGGKDGSLLIMRIDRNSSKMALQHAVHTDENEHNDGPVVDMQTYEQSSPSVIIYATLYGAIVAWDTRMQNTAWRLQNELRHGVITAICADPTGSWLAAGTSGGKHICWDLRFQLPIAEIKHPSDSWIRKVACHPTEPSCLISATQSNNEVSIWNIETGHRQTVLWASNAPVLSNTSLNDPSTSCGILAGVVDNSPFVLTGSSDQRIRYWDLMSPKNSALIVPSAKDNLADVSFTYSSRLTDGSQVIEENIISLATTDLGSLRASTEETPRSGPEMPSHSHHDAITDLLMCKNDKQQTFIVSAARDGVIKLWK